MKQFIIIATAIVAFSACGQKEYDLVADYTNTMDNCPCTMYVGSENSSHYQAYASLKDSFYMIPLNKFEDYEGSALQKNNPAPFNYDNYITKKTVNGCNSAQSMEVNCISNQNIIQIYKKLLINDYFKDINNKADKLIVINENKLIITSRRWFCDNFQQCDSFYYRFDIDLTNYDSITYRKQYSTIGCYHEYYESEIFFRATGNVTEYYTDTLNYCNPSEIRFRMVLPSVIPEGDNILRSREFVEKMFKNGAIKLDYRDPISNGPHNVIINIPIDARLWAR